MNENFSSPEEKNENLPEESTSSSFFSAYKEGMMSEGGSSTPKPKPREERTQMQMMIEISTAVLEEMEKKKNKGSKVAAPDPFEGDRKDTKRFLMEVEIYLRMHPTEYDNDEKKCLFLLSYLRGKNTESWKKGQSWKIFDPKSGETALTFQVPKDEFKKHYLLADIQAEAQIKIEEAKMTDRADNYVNDFRGRPIDLEGWYEAAIRYDEQYKYYKAVQKPKRFQITEDKKKKVSINWTSTQLSEEERKKYMADRWCFRCAKQGHMSQDCPTKAGGERKDEKKKLSAREAYVKIQAIVGFLKWRKRLMLSPPPPISISNVVLAKQSQNSMHIPLSYNNEIGKVGTNALLDSGAGGLFMSPEKALKLGLERTKLPHRIKVFNVDGTANKTAWITQSVTAQYTIGMKEMMDTFLISGLGKEEVILGLPWL
uniref:CCHC-type domain-containing protein n=1 Tax=Moniliophthora roreri TaxID=221103 RepID=A0A0W0FB59_MONRR